MNELFIFICGALFGIALFIGGIFFKDDFFK
jgi:hypothetical protein